MLYRPTVLIKTDRCRKQGRQNRQDLIRSVLMKLIMMVIISGKVISRSMSVESFLEADISIMSSLRQLGNQQQKFNENLLKMLTAIMFTIYHHEYSGVD